MVSDDMREDGSSDEPAPAPNASNPAGSRQQRGDVTQILSQIESGDPSAAEQLLPLLYDELRRLAAVKMAGESPDNTLQPTALVHEAYIRLVDVDQAQHWNSRGHFFGAAAEAMRRILVSSARRRNSSKRGGDLHRIDLDVAHLGSVQQDERLIALNDALTKLAKTAAEKAELVKLRYFAGLSTHEAAEAMGISTATADRYWAYARAWLQREIAPDAPAR